MSFTISDPKALSSAVLKKRSSDGSLQDDHDSLSAVAQELITAMEMKNPSEVAKALKKAFEQCDKEPHVEGEHLESESQE